MPWERGRGAARAPKAANSNELQPLWEPGPVSPIQPQPCRTTGQRVRSPAAPRPPSAAQHWDAAPDPPSCTRHWDAAGARGSRALRSGERCSIPRHPEVVTVQFNFCCARRRKESCREASALCRSEPPLRGNRLRAVSAETNEELTCNSRLCPGRIRALPASLRWG